MKPLVELWPVVQSKIVPPVCIAMGPVGPVAAFAQRIAGDVTCFQMDLHQARRLQEVIREDGSTAQVATGPDLWDLEPKFQTVLLPAMYDADRELKIDLVEQAWHVLNPGGKIVVVSEHTKDTLFVKLLKKYFGKPSISPPMRDVGTAFWATKVDEPREKRRHEVNYHARLPNVASQNIVCRPGLFSYGEFDMGSRAMIEVAELKPGERVLDMGCGVGTVGCLAGQIVGPSGHVTFVDSHLRAVQLAEWNARANGLTAFDVKAAAQFEGLKPGSYDVILANPPYYNNAEIAALFLATARRLLKPTGRLFFVTRMPTATVPVVFEVFGDCAVIENRGYSVIVAGNMPESVRNQPESVTPKPHESE
jgi:23S rRNA (guanine1835-N2)-methyltransferase